MNICNLIEPVILTMLPSCGVCMFCNTPYGDLCTKHLCLDTLFGYYSCKKPECIQKMFNETNRWLHEKAYGDVNYLKGVNNFKILRSSGEIQDGWSFFSPFVFKDSYNDDIIKCILNTQNLIRWCKVQMLCEQNPRLEENNLNISKNKCIECVKNIDNCDPVYKKICNCNLDFKDDDTASIIYETIYTPYLYK